jgi:hypothetical protein
MTTAPLPKAYYLAGLVGEVEDSEAELVTRGGGLGCTVAGGTSLRLPTMATVRRAATRASSGGGREGRGSAWFRPGGGRGS